mmetsp:Transcript_56390/g.122780  ORF Transcript_56390/g.122780 Transcript_56390/m.122780 type:complete len:304 (+) Transcript_56390:223-1134(+)
MSSMGSGQPFQCVCGSAFKSAHGLAIHMARFCGMVDTAAADSFTVETDAADSAKRAADAENENGKRARSFVYADKMRHQVAINLAQLRYVKLVPGAHIDILKGCVSNWLLNAADALISDIADELRASDLGPRSASVIESLSTSVRSKLDLFDGLCTEHMESRYIQKHIPMVSPTRRIMPPTTVHQPPTSRNPDQPSTRQPRKPRSLIAYDFALDELLARLVEHSSTAREAIYETLISWSTKPPTSSERTRIIADITNGRVFLVEHPVFGLQARVSKEEADPSMRCTDKRTAIRFWPSCTASST